MWENQLRELNLSLKNKKVVGEFSPPLNNNNYQEKETPYVTRRPTDMETTTMKKANSS